jgi:hypothetical protein
MMRRAIEQTRPKLALEGTDARRDRGLNNVELIGGPREASRFGDGYEGSQVS